MTFSVVSLPEADRDVQQIVAWLHQRSPAGAESWYRAWLDMLDQLSRTASSTVRAPKDARSIARYAR